MNLPQWTVNEARRARAMVRMRRDMHKFGTGKPGDSPRSVYPRNVRVTATLWNVMSEEDKKYIITESGNRPRRGKRPIGWDRARLPITINGMRFWFYLSHVEHAVGRAG